MIRKLIVRAFIAFAALFALGFLALATVGYLVIRQPAFYSELRRQSDPAGEVTVEIEQQINELERWMSESLQRQSDHRAALRMGSAASDTQCDIYDPLLDIHSLQLTQTQLNSAASSGAGDVKNPRVQILDGRVRVGAEIEVGSTDLVVSFLLRPAVSPEGKLHLDILSTNVGNLRVPLKTLLQWFAPDKGLQGRKMNLDLSGSVPRLVVDLANPKHAALRIQSMECCDGTMTLNFRAPYLGNAPDHTENKVASARTR